MRGYRRRKLHNLANIKARNTRRLIETITFRCLRSWKILIYLRGLHGLLLRNTDAAILSEKSESSSFTGCWDGWQTSADDTIEGWTSTLNVACNSDSDGLACTVLFGSIDLVKSSHSAFSRFSIFTPPSALFLPPFRYPTTTEHPLLSVPEHKQVLRWWKEIGVWESIFFFFFLLLLLLIIIISSSCSAWYLRGSQSLDGGEQVGVRRSAKPARGNASQDVLQINQISSCLIEDKEKKRKERRERIDFECQMQAMSTETQEMRGDEMRRPACLSDPAGHQVPQEQQRKQFGETKDHIDGENEAMSRGNARMCPWNQSDHQSPEERIREGKTGKMTAQKKGWLNRGRRNQQGEENKQR